MTSLDGFIPTSSVNNGSWYNDFADKLLSENFLLTALEFHAELTESGKELPKLKEFFSNPGNFEHQALNKPDVIHSVNLPRSSSQATLDSLDLTRYSEDGERSNDDRVAILEFELRKAKETINALRANLTEAAESETNKSRLQEESVTESPTTQQAQFLSIKPHEQRALNFLINEYLLLNGYKLTSITFADENESQDFEDWDDVGLNSARPVELLYLYREGLKGTGFSACVETKEFGCQVSLYDEVQQNLHINELEAEISELTAKISSMNLEFSKKLSSLEYQKGTEVDSRSSLTPDPEYFEMIETIKSHEESETKSDKSNGDWTKIGDKFKKESIDLKSDSQSNFESISNDDKMESQSGVFETIESNRDVLIDNKKFEEFQDEIEIDSEADKLNENLTEVESDEINNEASESSEKINESIFKDEKGYEGFSNIINTSREVPDQFKNEILKHCDISVPIFSSSNILADLLQKTPLKELTTDHFIEILSNSLPKIIPNIILNKREEITPLLVLSICLNKDLSSRDKLLNLLFNLKKKPHAEERRVILQALLFIAQLKGSDTVENEVLPQCWEQITHKYVERRMLVAESCFIITPYVSETIRNSLIISIAQQLLQDREESVRKASVNILSLLIALISDEGKYSQVLDICIKTLDDESMDVISTVNTILLPTLAQWSFTLHRIQSDLFSKLLDKLKKDKHVLIINVIEMLLPYLIMTIANSENLLQYYSINHPAPAKRQEFCHLCKGLRDPSVFFKGSVGKVMGTFDFYTSKPEFDSSTWPELEWIMNVFIQDLLEVGDDSWEDSKILKALMTTLRNLCLGLGKNVTNYKIKTFLMERLVECENAIVSGQDCKFSIIPLYLVGVLSTYPEELQEMSNTLRRFICALPLCGVSLIPLQVTIEILSQYQCWQILVLDAIWEGVVHQRPLVRSGSASLLQHVIPHIPESLLSTKIMPALVTLTSDPEAAVKTSAVPALGMLTNAKEKAIKDKVYMTFQTLLQDSITLDNHALIIQLVKTIKSIYDFCERKFREEVIVPQLSAMAALASRTKSRDLVEVLTDAFSTITFSQAQVSPQCTFSSLLLGLRNLENVSSQLNLPYSEHIDSMIKEVERRLAASRETVSKSMTSPSGEAKRIANAVSSHVVVEDVKNRVTKMFNTRPNTLQNVSGIFKKKT